MHFFKTLIILVTITGISQGMDFSGVKIERSAALTKWPDEFYAQVAPGKTLPFVEKGELANVKKIALEGTKEKAAKLSLNNKGCYDWVNALMWSEQHLLNKPFETWTVEDLKKLNGCLTRLVASGDGSFRNDERAWLIRDLNPDEKKRFFFLMAQRNERNFTEEDLAWLDSVNHVFPDSDLIKPFLSSTLKIAQAAVIQYKNSNFRIASHDIINIASWVHFEIVKIHAWPEANKRTGRLIMCILLAQFGYRPPFFTDRQAYVDCFVKHLQNPSVEPLQQLVAQSLKKGS